MTTTEQTNSAGRSENAPPAISPEEELERQGKAPELIPCRPDEVLDTTKLEPYAREQLPEADGPLEVLQFPGGRANLTYLLRFGPTEYVLRRPPLGPIAKSSHDMGREHRVLSKLYAHLPLAPRSYHFCDDESIIGAPFQIMERRQGQVIRQVLPENARNDVNKKRQIGEMMIEVLSTLHLVDC